MSISNYYSPFFNNRPPCEPPCTLIDTQCDQTTFLGLWKNCHYTYTDISKDLFIHQKQESTLSLISPKEIFEQLKALGTKMGLGGALGASLGYGVRLMASAKHQFFLTLCTLKPLLNLEKANGGLAQRENRAFHVENATRLFLLLFTTFEEIFVRLGIQDLCFQSIQHKIWGISDQESTFLSQASRVSVASGLFTYLLQKENPTERFLLGCFLGFVYEYLGWAGSFAGHLAFDVIVLNSLFLGFYAKK